MIAENRQRALMTTWRIREISLTTIRFQGTAILTNNPHKARVYLNRKGGSWTVANISFRDPAYMRVEKVSTGPNNRYRADPIHGIHWITMNDNELDEFCFLLEDFKYTPGGNPNEQLLSFAHYNAKENFNTPVKPYGIKCTKQDLAQGRVLFEQFVK